MDFRRRVQRPACVVRIAAIGSRLHYCDCGSFFLANLVAEIDGNPKRHRPRWGGLGVPRAAARLVPFTTASAGTQAAENLRYRLVVCINTSFGVIGASRVALQKIPALQKNATLRVAGELGGRRRG